MQDSRPRQMTTNSNMAIKPPSVLPVRMQNDMQYPIQIQNIQHRNPNIDKINR